MTNIDWRVVRDNLFEEQNFSADASIVFVPTAAGACGGDSIKQFCSSIPKGFLGADVEIEGRVVRESAQLNLLSSGTFVIEEFVYTFVHDAKLDCVLPGVFPTKKRISVAMALFIQFNNEGKISNLRLYWDQGTVLKQAGLFDTLHLMKSSAIEATLEQFPVAPYPSCARILNPSKHLNILVKQEQGNSNQGRTFSVADALSGKDMPAEQKEAKAAPHRISSVFSSEPLAEDNQRTSIQVNSRRTESNIFSQEPLIETSRTSIQIDKKRYESNIFKPEEPVQIVTSKFKNIFVDEEEAVQNRPSITVDPKRYQSSIFAEPEIKQPSQQSLSSYSKRNGQTINDPVNERPSISIDLSHNKQSFNVFSNDVNESDAKPNIVLDQKRNQQSFSIFSQEQEPQAFIPSTGLSSRRFESHINGAGLSTTTDDSVMANKKTDPRCNQSNFKIGEADEQEIKYQPKNNFNSSQIAFGTNDSPLKFIPSSRVLQPPGGKSSIVF